MLTILHVAPTPFFSDRGCHIRIRGIVLGLTRAGTRNIVCTYHHGNDVTGVETRRIRPIRGYNYVNAGPSPYKYLANIYLFIKVLKETFNVKPDILHGHLHEGALIAWVVRWCLFWRRIRVVMDMQGSLTGELTEYGYFERFKVLRRVFRGLENLIIRLPSHVFCSSASSLRILRKDFGLAAARCSLVADGMEVAIRDDATRSRERQRLGLPSHAAVVVYSGSLLPIKGLGELHTAMLDSNERQTDCHFLLIGYPVDATRDFVTEHGLAARVTLLGQLAFEKLPGTLALADLAVEPKAAASGEASGKLLNYVGARLPVICFDTVNNRELLGDEGYYCPVGDAHCLAREIETVIADPEAATRRAEAAFVRLQGYTWDAGARHILDVYARLGVGATG